MKREMTPGMAGGMEKTALLCRFTNAELASDHVVPVVLEFEQPPVAVYQRLNPGADAESYAAKLAEVHQEFLQKLGSQGMEVQVGRSTVVEASPSGSAVISVPHRFTQVFNGMGVLMPGRVVTQVAKMTGVRAVTLNTERAYLNLDKSVPFTGAPMAWERLDLAERNIRGQDVVVAVIDTGAV